MRCVTARSIATLLLALAAGALTERVDINNYFRLINDVHSYYRTSCVIFVLSYDYHDLNTTTLMHTWSREFSRRRVMTATLSLADLKSAYDKYRTTVVRPLFVVLLDGGGAANEFARATSSMRPMSFPVWLVVFLQNPEDDGEQQQHCRQPAGNVFNVDFSTVMLVKCHDQPALMEWYAVNDNRTRMFELATWSPDEGLVLRTTKSFYARRCDMFGETMRVASVSESPFFLVGNDGTIGGFFGLLLIELSRVMNFTPEILDPVEAYGSWNRSENTWTGVIGQLVIGEADIGVTEFTLTTGRLNVVDFTSPLILSQYRLYFKRPNKAGLHWSGYFQTFSSEIWIMIVTVIITASILLSLMKAKKRFSASLLSENYTRVWGIYCQQSLSEFPNESSTRLVFFSIYVSAFIVSSAYSASLISYLTLSTASLPFSTVEGFVKDGSYKLIVMRHSAEYDVYDQARDALSLKMYKLIEEKHLPVGLKEGFQQICKQKNLAYLTTQIFEEVVNLPCKVAHINTGRADNLAMTLPKNSPYTVFINYHLRRFKDNGVMNKLRNKLRLDGNRQKASYNAVNFEDVIPTLTVMACGVVLAVCILTIEKAYCIFNCSCKSSDCPVKKPGVHLHVPKSRGKCRKKLTKLNMKL